MDKGGAEQITSGLQSRSSKRRRNHRHHQSLSRRSGRSKEITIITLVALLILFGVLYLVLPRDQPPRDESSLAPSVVSPLSPTAPALAGQAPRRRG